MSSHRFPKNSRVIFDVLYGFVPITEWEEKIINSPFFQRLRWIKQLGFANYIFPGAEHNRFAHVIGVMHSMDQMLRTLGIAVPDDQLFNPKARNKQALLHKSLRIAALLHDIGTFPFSHSVEFGYMRHGTPDDAGHLKKRQPKDLPNSHEHLGSFIIKNTNYDGGITRVLEEYGLDMGLISKIIKGDSPYLIANQLMHSDLDADRMDYLMRDAHYTGIKYGQFDREYLMSNLALFDAGGGQVAFGVTDNAQLAVEDFLIARFGWYSQVIKNQGSAKFDIIASHLATAFLDHKLIHSFHDLLAMIESQDERFYWWNDIYFMTQAQTARYDRKIRDPKVLELTEMLLYRKPPKTLHHELFEHRLIEDDGTGRTRTKLEAKIRAKVAEFERVLKKHGKGKEWMLVDIPQKDVVFTKGPKQFKSKGTVNPCSERDPIKIVDHDGKPSLLVQRDNSLMSRLAGVTNFIPSVYANEAAWRLLKDKGLVSR